MLLMMIAALGLAVAPRPAHAADSAVDVYGGCMVAKKAGDLLIIIDESRSLDTNDPDHARISSAKYLLTQLNSFAERAKVTLDVSIAGFSHNYAQVQDWTALDDDGLDTTLEAVDSFADREYGFETDYWMALEGARRSLAEHNPDGDRCQALVWISDGGLDVDWRRDAQQREDYGTEKPYLEGTPLDSEEAAVAAEEEAEHQLCRDGGLADQLRSSKVTMFGVGLRGEERPDYTLMKSITLGGDAGGQHCGKITKPPGNFTEAANIDELLFEFDKFTTPNQERKETESGICQGEPCPEERHTFVLDDSIQSVHILGSSDAEDAEVYLVTPDEQEVQLARGTIGQTDSADQGEVSIDYSWQSQKTVVIDMAAAASGTAGWSGPWSVVFVDPSRSSPDGKSRTSIAISGDVFPAWPDADQAELRSGEPAEIQLGLVNADGDSIDPASLLGTVSMDVTLETADGETTSVASGLDAAGIVAPITLDLTDVPPGEATLAIALSITTADAQDAQGKTVPGTELQPQSVRVPLRVEPPAGFPTLGNLVNFGALEGKAEGVAGELEVTGPGCVWVPGDGSPQIMASPEEIGAVSITSEHNSAESCLRVAEGDTGQLPVQLTTEGAGNGTLNADFTVMISPEDLPDRAREATAVATASFEKPLNPVNFTLTLIVAAILGPGIPLLLLYLMKWLTAKIPGQALLAQEFPVTVESGQVLRDGGRFGLAERDLSAGMVQLSNKGSRSAQAASVMLRAKMGASPFGEGYVVVESPGRIGASSSDTRPHGKELAARLPLNVHNHWVLLHDPQGPPTQATILLLVGAAAPPEVRTKLVDDVNSRVPDVLAALRSLAGASDPGDGAAGGSPFGGGDPGGGQPDGPAPFDFGPSMPGADGPAGNPFGGSGPAGPPPAGPPPAGPPPAGPPPAGPAPAGPAPAGPPQAGPAPGGPPPAAPPTPSSAPSAAPVPPPFGPPGSTPPTIVQETGGDQGAPGEAGETTAPGGQPDQFRPAAPPPGTQITNPFEFGDNSGR